MGSLMMLYTRKKHPEYSEDECWDYIWQYCIDNERKIKLGLKYYGYKAKDLELRAGCAWLNVVVSEAYDRVIQRVLRELTNFEIAMLLLISNDDTKKKILRNMSKRLTFVIKGEAHTIIRNMSLKDEYFLTVLQKVKEYFKMDDVRIIINKIERGIKPFSISQTGDKEHKKYLIKEYGAIVAGVNWNKVYQKKGISEKIYYSDMESYYLKEFHKLLADTKYREALDMAYEYSDKAGGQSSVIVSGMELDENDSIVFVSYLIRKVKERRIIYRRENEMVLYPDYKYDLPDRLNDDCVVSDKLKPLLEVTEEQFVGFCDAIYTDTPWRTIIY